jgi:peptide/nickel transport system substrate-binding protein
MEDDRTFVFRLRDNVVWQDLPPVDGRRLVADDVVFSLERQLASGGTSAGRSGAMRLLEASGPDEVRIGLAAPDSDFLLSLADGRAKIVARDAVEVGGDLKQGPTIGSGPWVAAGSVSGAFHRFERNTTYFEKDLPFVDSLVLHVIPNATTRDAAFSVETVDVHQMEPQTWTQLLQRRPDVQSLLVKETGVGLEVALNTSRPPFDDIDVRRAAFQAMDPWAAINGIWMGTAYVSLGFPAMDAGWLLSDTDLRRFFAKPDTARDLLEAANTGRPNAVSITVGDFGERYVAHARRIAAELEAVGFAPALEIVDRRRFGEEVWLGGDYQLFVGPVAPVLSPNAYLIPVLHSLGTWNTTAHVDPELDALIEAQAQESDPVGRARLIREIQEIALGRAYRFMPATSISIWVAWPRVRNLHPNFSGFEYIHWSRVWLEN